MIFSLQESSSSHTMSRLLGNAMSKPASPLPVKPVVSLMLARTDLAAAAIRRLAEFFGPPDLVSPIWPYEATNYYQPEMGSSLGRQLVAFLHLADSSRLPDWKIFTNTWESRFSLGARRLVNLDPGYLTPDRLVLATGKNYAHRLHLGQGIFGDLALQYRAGECHPLPWSYPDYAQGPLPAYLLLARRKYLWQLQRLRGF
jgi:hypothetical protein